MLQQGVQYNHVINYTVVFSTSHAELKISVEFEIAKERLENRNNQDIPVDNSCLFPPVWKASKNPTRDAGMDGVIFIACIKADASSMKDDNVWSWNSFTNKGPVA